MCDVSPHYIKMVGDLMIHQTVQVVELIIQNRIYQAKFAELLMKKETLPAVESPCRNSKQSCHPARLG
jgi:hypothetical protein